MIIPARRLLWLAAVPFAVILGGRGEPGAIVAAWVLMGSLLAAFVVDGFLAGQAASLASVSRDTGPASRRSARPHCLDRGEPQWVSAGARALRSGPRRGSRRPAHAGGECAALDPARPFHYELIPSERGMAAFGDLDYRIRGPLGLAWLQKRLPARLEIRCLPHLANAKAAELAERRALLRQAGSHRYRWRAPARRSNRCANTVPRTTFAGSTGRPPRG